MLKQFHHPVLLIVYYDLGFGGVQRKIVDITNTLPQIQKYQRVCIRIILEQRKKKTLTELIQNPNAKIHYKPLYRMPFWLFIFLHLLFSRTRNVLVFLAIPSVYVVKLRRLIFWRKIRVVIGQDTVTTDAQRRGDYSKLFLTEIRKWFPQADKIIVPSRVIKNDLVVKHHIPNARIAVMPNWSTITIVPKKKIYDLIYIGRMDAEKQLVSLISLIKKITKIYPKIKLLIVGQG